MEYVEKALAFAEEQLSSELATPILVSMAAVLFLVILFYTLAPKKVNKSKKSTNSSEKVRRSTRAGKATAKFTPEAPAPSPAPAKSASKKKAVPATPETASPTKRSRGRPTKKAAEITPTPTPRRTSRARKA